MPARVGGGRLRAASRASWAGTERSHVREGHPCAPRSPPALELRRGASPRRRVASPSARGGRARTVRSDDEHAVAREHAPQLRRGSPAARARRRAGGRRSSATTSNDAVVERQRSERRHPRSAAGHAPPRDLDRLRRSVSTPVSAADRRRARDAQTRNPPVPQPASSTRRGPRVAARARAARTRCSIIPCAHQWRRVDRREPLVVVGGNVLHRPAERLRARGAAVEIRGDAADAARD